MARYDRTGSADLSRPVSFSDRLHDLACLAGYQLMYVARQPLRQLTSHRHRVHARDVKFAEKTEGGGIRNLVTGKPPETVFEYAARPKDSPCLLRFSAFAGSVG